MAIGHMKGIQQISIQFPTGFIRFEETAVGGNGNDVPPFL